MAAKPDARVTRSHFAGSGKVYSQEADGLGAVVRNVLIQAARRLLRLLNQVLMTDSSGGTAGAVFTADATGGAAGEDIVIFGAPGHTFQTGDGPVRVRNSGGGLPGGLSANTDYFVVKVNSTTIKLATSKAKALKVVPDVVQLTTDGTGTQFMDMLAYMVVPPVADTSSAGGATAASINTSADTLADAYAVLLTRINKARTLFGLGTVDDGPGTVATEGTIAAIDVDVAAASGDSSASQASVAKMFGDLLHLQRHVVDALNEVVNAVGGAGMAAFGGLAKYTGVPQIGAGKPEGANLTLNFLTGTSAISDAATVAAGTSATTGVTEAAIETALVVLQKNVAELADMVDGVLDAGTTQRVVQESSGVINLETTATTTMVARTSGRIRTFRADNAGAAHVGTYVVTLQVNGSAITGASLSLATLAAGASSEDTVADAGNPGDANSNYVAEGDIITIASDQGGTSGTATIVVYITPTAETEIPLTHVAA